MSKFRLFPVALDRSTVNKSDTDSLYVLLRNSAGTYLALGRVNIQEKIKMICTKTSRTKINQY